MADPKLVELGLTPSADAYKAQFYTYLMNGLMTQLVRIEPGNNVEEAHMRNRQLIARWVYEKGAADKVVEAGNKNVMLTERGTTFGYQDLVVDYRGIPEMQSFGYPVILDVTHSLQQPNQTSGVTGGMPQLIETVAKAGIAVGADGIFIETHENPAVAKSDGANMLKLDLLEGLLTKLVRIREAIK